jgi:hypothetical protein
MKIKNSLIAAFVLVLAVPTVAAAKDKHVQRAMLESMQSVPCGAKERGVTGLGSMFASLGVEHVNSHEQLCPQYLLRTDQMDFHIRPMDLKHAVVLPIGQEAIFKIKKDRMLLRIGDGKERAYQVVSMEPIKTDATVEGTAYRPAMDPADPRPPSTPVNQPVNQVAVRPPQP